MIAYIIHCMVVTFEWLVGVIAWVAVIAAGCGIWIWIGSTLEQRKLRKLRRGY
jgi:hypothetical protein